MNRFQLLALTSTLAGAALLGACGGGAGSADAPTDLETAPASDVAQVQGTITGFGSVIVDGVRYDDSSAKVAFNVDPGNTSPATLGDLKMGHRVDAKLVDGKLTDLVVSFAMMGPVDSVKLAQGSFVVFGQAINLVLTGSSPTALEGFATLADLAAGDLVKVAGVVNADKTITATRVERRAPDALAKIRVTGIVGDLNPSAKTFTFGVDKKLLVNFANATVLPAGATIANGNTLAVYAEVPATTGSATPTLTAKTVEVLERKLPDGVEVSVGGPVSDFQSLSHFKIGEVLVDASTATLIDGTTAADLVNGAKVYAKGKVKNQVLVATTLKVSKPENEDKPRLIGQVTDYVSLSQFKLRGVNVDASHATFAGGVATDIANGTWLDVTGKIAKDTVLADLIKVTPPPAAVVQTMTGQVRDYNATSKTFMLLGVSMRLTADTRFGPASQGLGDMARGWPVEVKGSYSESTRIFTVNSVLFKEPVPTIKRVEIGGVISAMAGNGFKFGDALVIVNTTTTFAPEAATFARLTAGMRIKLVALADPNAQTLTAVSVEVLATAPGEAPPPAATVEVRLRGAVTDFVSLANFRVAGQKVDAGGANVLFDGGLAAAIANGSALDVEGTLTKATNVVTLKAVHFPPK